MYVMTLHTALQEELEVQKLKDVCNFEEASRTKLFLKMAVLHFSGWNSLLHNVKLI